MSAITTTVVGSYPQPDWLVDKARYRANVVPRVRMPDLWRVAPDLLEEAQDDAVRLAVRDMERAGIDTVSDGEQRRESYFNQFATGLDGVELDFDPGAHILLMRNEDKPGVIGQIGSQLGAAGINIVNFSLGAKGDGQALAAITVDRPVPTPRIAELRAIPGIVALEMM